MKSILFLLLFVGLVHSFHTVYTQHKNVTIRFEVGPEMFTTYSVKLGHIMNEVCESKTKELKINVQASRPVNVHLCHCNEKAGQKAVIQKLATRHITLSPEESKNLSLIICGAEFKNDELEFTISGLQGTKGVILMEVVDTKGHSTLEVFYEFKVTEDDGVLMNLTEFENLSRLAAHQPMFEMNHHIPAGLYQHFLQMIVELDEPANYTATFMKCGMKALQVERMMTDNQFIFEPGMLRLLDDVAEYACLQNDTPLQMFIGGKLNTSGTVIFRIIQNQGTGFGDLSDSWGFPMLHFVVFVFILFALLPMIYYAEVRQQIDEKDDEGDKDFASMWSM
uniref:Vacuolar ATP synthase subunit S1 n=1 Tax=Caenorhabditis tropicalis TaxID=1561998 RepID=A0A1I7U657_9PELO